MLVKCAAHWTATSVPLIVVSPLLGLFMNVDGIVMAAVAATLFAGTPAITFIGAVGAAVSVSLPRGGLLISVLVLPLSIPVLIFGVSAVEDPASFLPPFLILCALTLFFSVLGPLAASAALRASAD